MTILDTRSHTARKEHRCIWCPEKILPKETYAVETCIFEGDFQSNKYHPECLKACKEMARKEDRDFDFSEHEFKRGTTEER
jgi:hypothetical protein